MSFVNARLCGRVGKIVENWPPLLKFVKFGTIVVCVQFCYGLSLPSELLILVIFDFFLHSIALMSQQRPSVFIIEDFWKGNKYQNTNFHFRTPCHKNLLNPASNTLWVWRAYSTIISFSMILLLPLYSYTLIRSKE